MGEPLPICFLNGEFLPLREARISPLDRGFLYSDGAYEVTPVYGGRPFRFAQHHDRLTRSLKEIRMEDPLSRGSVARPVSRAHRAQRRELVRRLYICAGDARRRTRPQPRAAAGRAAHGVRVRRALAAPAAPAGSKTACPPSRRDDTRWARCDIKSVSLLANVLLRQLAVDARRQRNHPAARRPAHRRQRVERARGHRRRAAARRPIPGSCCPAPRAASSRKSRSGPA